MHDFSTLGADIVSLMKRTGTSGTTGTTGTTCEKALGQRDYFGPTRDAHVVPRDLRLGPSRKTSGTKDVSLPQALVDAGPTGPSDPTHFERGRANVGDASQALRKTHIPDGWRDGFRALRAADPHDDFGPQAWSQMLADARAFLATWGEQIARLGWRDVDVFGLDPIAPGARVGCYGLAFLIHGGIVVAVTARSAAIRRPSNASLTWRRCDGPQVPAWELVGGAR